MALGGDLSKIDLTAIFQTLALNQQVGTLVVTEKTTGRKTSLYFDQHSVSLVSSDKKNYFRLGQILINRGIISEEVLRRALEQQKRGGGLLGEVLCTMGVTSAEEVEEVVRSQIEEEIFELFQWKNARFEFLEGSSPAKSSLDSSFTTINFDPNGLLMEAARRLDEWEVMKEYLPSLNEILIIDEEAWDDAEFEDLSVADRAIIDLLDGERDIEDIAADTSLPRFDICRTLFNWLRERKVRALKIEELTALAADAENSNNIPLAIKFYTRSIARSGATEHLAERIAHCHDIIGEAREAASYYTKLGDVRWEASKIGSAVDAYRRAIELNSGETTALERLFEHAANEGNSEGVLKIGKSLLKSYMRDLQVAEAADLCRGLLERFPADIELRKQMINIHLDRRDAKAAAKEYDEILELLKPKRAWSEMSDVCSKIVQLDPDRDDMRALIEVYRIRSERSFKKIIRKPIVVLPTAGIVMLLIFGTIFYNIVAGKEFAKAREAYIAGFYDVALDRFNDVTRRYSWSIYARRARREATSIATMLEERERAITRASSEISTDLEVGKEAFRIRRLVASGNSFQRVVDKGTDSKIFPDRSAREAVLPRVQEAERYLGEIEGILVELEARRLEAEQLIGAEDLAGAAVIIDQIEQYEIGDELARSVKDLRGQVFRMDMEGSAIALHSVYKDARRAEASADFGLAEDLYKTCLEAGLDNLERLDAARFLSLVSRATQAVAEKVVVVDEWRQREDWVGMNQAILELIAEFPRAAEVDEVADQLRYRVFVDGAPEGARVVISRGGTELTSVVADRDGHGTLDIPPFPPEQLQVTLDAPGYSFADRNLSVGDLTKNARLVVKADREPLWVAPEPPFGAIVGGPTIADGKIWVPNRLGSLRIYDLATGECESTFEGSASRELVAPALVHAGRAYLGVLNGQEFLCIGPGSGGAAEQVFGLPVTGYMKGAAALLDGLIIFGCSDSKVRAITPAGDQRWEVTVDAGVEADIATDGERCYVATVAGQVSAISAKGEVIWQKPAGGQVTASMAVDDRALYVGTWHGTVLAFDLATGEELWKNTCTLDEGVAVRGGLARASGVVVVAASRTDPQQPGTDRAGVCYLVDAETGEFQTGGIIDVPSEPLIASPIASGDRFYLGGNYIGREPGGGVYCFRVEGLVPVPVWQWQGAWPIAGRMDFAEGKLVVASPLGVVLVFNP